LIHEYESEILAIRPFRLPLLTPFKYSKVGENERNSLRNCGENERPTKAQRSDILSFYFSLQLNATSTCFPRYSQNPVTCYYRTLP